jgi:hypothetical protein
MDARALWRYPDNFFRWEISWYWYGACRLITVRRYRRQDKVFAGCTWPRCSLVLFHCSADRTEPRSTWEREEPVQLPSTSLLDLPSMDHAELSPQPSPYYSRTRSTSKRRWLVLLLLDLDSFLEWSSALVNFVTILDSYVGGYQSANVLALHFIRI